MIIRRAVLCTLPPIKHYRGVDDPKVVSGQPLFGIDIQLPGMVYANYTKCPAAGGRVRSFNVDEIKAQRYVPRLVTSVAAANGDGSTPIKKSWEVR